ncbi:MAG: hypothetical protein LBH43_09850 [Treponema sp.]|nr:hypothetical protein [Treponema sp.]
MNLVNRAFEGKPRLCTIDIRLAWGAGPCQEWDLGVDFRENRVTEGQALLPRGGFPLIGAVFQADLY